MYCPHCGNEFKVTGPTPGGMALCPACGKGFPDPSAPAPLPPTGAAGKSVAGVLMIVIGVTGCVLLGCGGVFVALLLPAISSAQEAAHRMSCANNLKQIGLAFHNYESVHGAFPAQSVTDENGKPMHSWRVAILPFMEQAVLAERYNFDEPWDGPNNRLVADQILSVYQCPASERTKGTNFTNYFVVYGDETAFGPNRWTKLSDFTDGTSNSILIVECDTLSVPWAEPTDIPFEQMDFGINRPDGSLISSDHPGGVNVLIADGSVRFMSETGDMETFRCLLIPNDGRALPGF